ncbi:MAG: hypothetical protein JG766_1559, partial [Desulfacinum sp.]|nr:hypothetical protein [Desulfacinum sp.]
ASAPFQWISDFLVKEEIGFDLGFFLDVSPHGAGHDAQDSHEGSIAKGICRVDDLRWCRPFLTG